MKSLALLKEFNDMHLRQLSLQGTRNNPPPPRSLMLPLWHFVLFSVVHSTGRTFSYLNANEAARGVMNYSAYTGIWSMVLDPRWGTSLTRLRFCSRCIKRKPTECMASFLLCLNSHSLVYKAGIRYFSQPHMEF